MRRVWVLSTALVLALSLVALNGASGPLATPAGFVAARSFTAGVAPFSIAIGDLNGDAQPDLAVANLASDDVSVLLGRGHGTFAPQARYASGSDPISVAIADLNGDSRPDLAVANNSSNASPSCSDAVAGPSLPRSAMRSAEGPTRLPSPI